MSTTWNNLQALRVSVDSHVARITLARPDRLNAFDPVMLTELLAVLEAIADDREVNVVVLTGEGRAFCAGVDLETPFFMENVEGTSVFEGTRLLDWQHRMILALHELPQPTIAAVNGAAVGGGGFGMAMACDMRFCVDSATFFMVPGRLSVVQDFGLTWTLQRQIGSARTTELVYSGRRVKGPKAAEWGIVNESFATLDELQAHVDSVASVIGSMGSDSVRMLKNVVRTGETSPLREQLRLEAISNGLCFQSEEFQQAQRELLAEIRKG